MQKARHFSLLTGHYSRWHFHHPGPAFLYLFALGEFVFHDILHAAPAPFNGQLIMMIIANVALLFTSFWIIRRHLAGRFLVPLALAATTLVTVMVNRDTQQSMLISNWMPDVLLFAFLLFAVSTASILAGDVRDLPWLALAGMLLIHAHVAQILFVGVLGGGAVGGVLVRALRAGRMRAFWRENRRHFVIAWAVCALFALPPLLDLVLHHPNNLDDIRAYLGGQGVPRNSIATSIRYLACFALFIPDPQIVLQAPGGIPPYVLGHLSILVYWVFFAAVSMVTLVLARRDTRPPPGRSFVKFLCLVAVGAGLLFLYWGLRITGDMYSFNGRFIFALHLIAWFVVLGELSNHLSERQTTVLTAMAGVFILMFAFIERKALHPAVWAYSIPDALNIARAVPRAPAGKLEIALEGRDWRFAIGVANQMERMDKPFCVGPDWGFMFTPEHVCPDELATSKLSITRNNPGCTLPCRVLYRGPMLSAMEYPVELSLPVEIGILDSAFVSKAGFSASEGSYRWTQKHAAIRFPLTGNLPNGGCFKLALRGFVHPGGSVRVSLNSRLLGTWTSEEPAEAALTVPRDALRAGNTNMVSFDGETGYGFIGLSLRAPHSGEGCIRDASPHYASFAPLGKPPADFNGDGYPDLVWWDPGSGGVQVWLMGGIQGITRIGLLPLPKPNRWRLAAVTDLNGDGHPDLVWQDPKSGETRAWFLGGPNGTTTVETAPISGIDHWRVVATADFNGDGHPDLVWQDTGSGHARIQYLGGPLGVTLLGWAELTAENKWRIAGAGDFDGDGRPDLVWQDPIHGDLQVWYLGGTRGNVTTRAAELLGTAGDWRIAAVSDLNRDGHPDLVWQDPVSGASTVWFMGGPDGTKQFGTAPLSSASGGRIMGPR